MKKVISLILVMLLMVTLAACDNKTPVDNEESSAIQIEDSENDTVIEKENFQFTPKQFVERLTIVAEDYVGSLSYEMDSDMGLLVDLFYGEKQAYLQFCRRDTSLLKLEEWESDEVWCVSLIFIGEADLNLRRCFFMACDPSLDMDEAGEVDIVLITAFLNASSLGETFGYYMNNDLLYEYGYVEADDMHVFDIYASDFRKNTEQTVSNDSI
ncbi:MAG: hypothetical protein IKT42_01120 [Clostridia bacterium]|nr:hypothetical protein [Clostridia bacterium]